MVRAALEEAVAARTGEGAVVASDLSGGLADQAETLSAPLSRFRPSFGWEQPLRMPDWTTEAATDAVRRQLVTCSAELYSPLRAQHQSLSSVRSIAASVDGVRILTGRVGAPVHAPYLDDHVVAACLAVRLDQRAVPGAYKPLTRVAMRPVIPAECLERTTKGEFSADIYRGLRRHRDQLLTLLDGSLLVQRGLADAAALRRACVQGSGCSARFAVVFRGVRRDPLMPGAFEGALTARVDEPSPIQLELCEHPADRAPAHLDVLLAEFEGDPCRRPLMAAAHSFDLYDNVAWGRGGLPVRRRGPVD